VRRTREGRAGPVRAELGLEPYARLSRPVVDELTAEGLALLAFTAADAEGHEVRVRPQI
jgi:hypothetical protein